jgi:hypothetical protein
MGSTRSMDAWFGEMDVGKMRRELDGFGFK